jgi:hypothetical protein
VGAPKAFGDWAVAALARAWLSKSAIRVFLIVVAPATG